MVSLIKGYVSKVYGVVNPPNSEKVLAPFLDLATSTDETAFEFVSGNMCGVSLRHM